VWGIYEGVPGEGGAPNQYTGEASAMGTGKNIHEPKAEGRIFAGRICEMPSEPADDKAAGGGGRGEHRMGPNPRMAGLRPPLLPRGGEGIGAVPSTAYIRPRGGQRGRGRPTRQGAPEEGAGPRGYRANTYREPGGVKGQRGKRIVWKAQVTATGRGRLQRDHRSNNGGEGHRGRKPSETRVKGPKFIQWGTPVRRVTRWSVNKGDE